jgi:hypothetical protein
VQRVERPDGERADTEWEREDGPHAVVRCGVQEAGPSSLDGLCAVGQVVDEHGRPGGRGVHAGAFTQRELASSIAAAMSSVAQMVAR